MGRRVAARAWQGVAARYDAGRRLVLTSLGETLRGYARRLLALNDQAVAATVGSLQEGPMRVGWCRTSRRAF